MQNIYGLPFRGKIDEDWEILANSYAVAFDSHNDIMLAPGNKFQPTEYAEIKRRFAELKRLARKYAPQKLRTVEAIERLALENHSGKITDRAYVQRLRMIAHTNNVNPMLLDQAEVRINMAEGMFGGRLPKFANPMNEMLRDAGRMFEHANKRVYGPRPRPRPVQNFVHNRRGSGPRPKSGQPMTPRELIKKMFGGGR